MLIEKARCLKKTDSIIAEKKAKINIMNTVPISRSKMCQALKIMTWQVTVTLMSGSRSQALLHWKEIEIWTDLGRKVKINSRLKHTERIMFLKKNNQLSTKNHSTLIVDHLKSITPARPHTRVKASNRIRVGCRI